ncbi:porin [Micromonospora sp. NBC_01699]|uniref:LppU/SCO3897 family protein n=1 Tax=Micromonospora sp. NBC_01699 TaxID=2975984 RepID=UPI002E297E9F|nr:porin [Micromonospora sp. NBC_01699]
MPVPPAPAKKSPIKKIVSVLVVIVVAVAVKFGVGAVLGGEEDKAAEAKVGDCLAALPEVAQGEEKDAPNAKVVECTSTEAAYNVVGRIDNQTEAQAKATTDCEQYAAEGEEYSIYYAIPAGGTGYVLCLKPKAA